MISPSSFLRRPRRAALLLAGALLLPAAVPAQTLSGQTSATAPNENGPGRLISTNPFLPLFGYFSAEYEQRVRDNVSFAIAGSHIKLDDRYTNLDAKIRLYPNEKALDGFGIAASLGIGWVKQVDNLDICIDDVCEREDFKTIVTPSFAMEIGYQWMLGRTKSTAVTGSLGAKRYLSGNLQGIERVVPTGRLSIGYAF